MRKDIGNPKQGLPVAGGKAKEFKGALAKSVGQSLPLRLKHSDGETYSALMTAAAKLPG
jgi:hypothetical protein